MTHQPSSRVNADALTDSDEWSDDDDDEEEEDSVLTAAAQGAVAAREAATARKVRKNRIEFSPFPLEIVFSFARVRPPSPLPSFRQLSCNAAGLCGWWRRLGWIALLPHEEDWDE